MVFFVVKKTVDRAKTTATAQNCKQSEHLFCLEKTPSQKRPDVFFFFSQQHDVAAHKFGLRFVNFN